MLYLMFTLALISPGPDLILIIRSGSLNLKAGIWTALGICTGICFYLALVFFGLDRLFVSYPWLLTITRGLGALFLFYMGIKGLKSGHTEFDLTAKNRIEKSSPRYFLEGLSANILNPKALVFFVSLLTQFLDTQAGYQIIPMIVLVIISLTWFCGIALLCNTQVVRQTLQTHARALNLMTAWLLIAFAIFIVYSEIKSSLL